MVEGKLVGEDAKKGWQGVIQSSIVSFPFREFDILLTVKAFTLVVAYFTLRSLTPCYCLGCFNRASTFCLNETVLDKLSVHGELTCLFLIWKTLEIFINPKNQWTFWTTKRKLRDNKPTLLYYKNELKIIVWLGCLSSLQNILKH